MGVHKALLKIGNRSLIEHTLTALEKVFKEIIIVSNCPDKYGWLKYRVVPDVQLGAGPLGGLFSALTITPGDGCLVAACDMPFVASPLAEYICSIQGYEAVVPTPEGRPEPLPAFYSKSCLPKIECLLSLEKFRLTDLLSEVRVYNLTDAEIAKWDPQLLSFVNINTWEDFYRAQKITQEEL